MAALRNWKQNSLSARGGLPQRDASHPAAGPGAGPARETACQQDIALQRPAMKGIVKTAAPVAYPFADADRRQRGLVTRKPTHSRAAYGARDQAGSAIGGRAVGSRDRRAPRPMATSRPEQSRRSRSAVGTGLRR